MTLIRHTVLYLPAQLLPAVAQFVSLIVWTHVTTPEAIGKVTLLVATQEFLVLGLMNFWILYTLRYGGAAVGSDAYNRFARTATWVVVGSAVLEGVIAGGLYLALIDQHSSILLLPLVALMVAGRAFNTFQAERGRARGDIMLYSLETMAGPVIGTIVGVVLLLTMGGGEFNIILGYAVAQAVGLVVGLSRDSGWLVRGRPDGVLLRDSLRYGAPLIAGAIAVWVTQNVARVLTGASFGLAAAGIYALGFGLGFRMATVASMSVTAAAFPLATRYTQAGDHAGAMRQLSANGILLLIVLAPAMAGFALIADDVIDLSVAAPLRAPVHPIALAAIAAGTIIAFRQHFVQQVFLLSGDTRPIGLVCAGEAVFAVIAALLLVPTWGAVGGIVSLVVTSIASLSVMLWLAVRTGYRPPWEDFARILAATAVMAALVATVPAGHGAVSIAGRVAVGAVIFILAAAIAFGRRSVDLLASFRQRGLA